MTRMRGLLPGIKPKLPATGGQASATALVVGATAASGRDPAATTTGTGTPADAAATAAAEGAPPPGAPAEAASALQVPQPGPGQAGRGDQHGSAAGLAVPQRQVEQEAAPATTAVTARPQVEYTGVLGMGCSLLPVR